MAGARLLIDAVMFVLRSLGGKQKSLYASARAFNRGAGFEGHAAAVAHERVRFSVGQRPACDKLSLNKQISFRSSVPPSPLALAKGGNTNRLRLSSTRFSVH